MIYGSEKRLQRLNETIREEQENLDELQLLKEQLLHINESGNHE